MPHIITFSKITRVDRILIGREGEALVVRIDAVLATDDNPQRTQREAIVPVLSDAEKQQLIAVVKGLVQNAGTEYDVEIPDWAKP